MGNLWPYLDRISTLLEEDERQSVLGDIQERGADARALLDVTALVALRQLQTWTSWRPWLLSAALFFPAAFVVYTSFALAQVIHSGHLFTDRLYPWAVIGAPVLAWAAGFSLGSIGKHRAASVLPLLTALFGCLFWNEAQSVTKDGAYGVALVLLSTALLAAIPIIHGFRRGFQNRPLPRRLSIAITILGVSAAIWFVPQTRPAWLFIPPATLWPAVYALSKAVRPNPWEIANIR